MTTYHFEEESSEMSNIRRTDFSSRWENNDIKIDVIKIRKIYKYICLYLNQLYSTKNIKGDMESTQIQYQVRYKIFHLILEHAYPYE